MKILVTGHMGVLGRQLARYFKEGNDVHGCDLRGGLDCRDTFRVNDLQYDIVFHCANDDVEARRLGTDADFFAWMDRTKPKKVVFISSADVYPMALQNEPYHLKEVDAEPDTPRGLVLRTVEKLAEDRGAYIFRPFELYGEAGRGVFHQIATMVNEQQDPFRAPGCGRVLDYIHVDDAIATILAALESPPTGPVNLCTGRATAVDELALLMFEVADWKPRNLFCDNNDEAFFRCGSTEKMRTIRPPTIPLLDGILDNFPRTSI